MHCIRGLILLACGDADGAESDAVLTVELAPPVRDPQVLYPDLAAAAAIFLSVGNEARAGQTMAEAVAGLGELHRLGFAVIQLPLLAWVAVTLGRESELIEVLEREPFKSPWLPAGLAASRDFRAAADIFGEMGIPSDEAFSACG
jgi:hypothetical protein